MKIIDWIKKLLNIGKKEEREPYFHQYTQQPRPGHKPSWKRPHSHKKKNHYLIEFRFIDRQIKSEIKEIERDLAIKFRLRREHFVPHITLVGGFITDEEDRLIHDFLEICEKAPTMKFQVKGFSFFEEPSRVVYLDIIPSGELKQFRYDLGQTMQSYCQLKPYDFHDQNEFAFHSTVCLNPSERKFKILKSHVSKYKFDYDDLFLARTTLIKGDKILYEYDFFLRQLLNRNQARDPLHYRRTEEAMENSRLHQGSAIEHNSKKVFLISDTHFDHENIIRYCNRPFSNKDEMNETLVNNWNNLVNNSDTVYFLGDLSYGRNSRPADYWIRILNGKIIFIRGSHDRNLNRECHDSLKIHHGGKDFLLIHDPSDIPADWRGWVIHGHHHNHDFNKYPFINGDRKTINVSVELLNYKPLNIEDLFNLNYETIGHKDTN